MTIRMPDGEKGVYDQSMLTMHQDPVVSGTDKIRIRLKTAGVQHGLRQVAGQFCDCFLIFFLQITDEPLVS